MLESLSAPLLRIKENTPALSQCCKLDLDFVKSFFNAKHKQNKQTKAQQKTPTAQFCAANCEDGARGARRAPAADAQPPGARRGPRPAPHRRAARRDTGLRSPRHPPAHTPAPRHQLTLQSRSGLGQKLNTKAPPANAPATPRGLAPAQFDPLTAAGGRRDSPVRPGGHPSLTHAPGAPAPRGKATAEGCPPRPSPALRGRLPPPPHPLPARGQAASGRPRRGAKHRRPPRALPAGTATPPLSPATTQRRAPRVPHPGTPSPRGGGRLHPPLRGGVRPRRAPRRQRLQKLGAAAGRGSRAGGAGARRPGQVVEQQRLGGLRRGGGGGRGGGEEEGRLGQPVQLHAPHFAQLLPSPVRALLPAAAARLPQEPLAAAGDAPRDRAALRAPAGGGGRLRAAARG